MGSATVRVMSAEEIVARPAGETPYFQWPERTTFFAEREMRLRQLAGGHVMEDFLRFMADIAHAQQARLAAFPPVPTPDGAMLEQAASTGHAPLPASDWPRDPAWHGVLRGLVADLKKNAPIGAVPALERIAEADDTFLEIQADCLLTGVISGLDFACAPLIAAALQVYWTHLVIETRQYVSERGQELARAVDETVCPCCGSLPVVSITRTAGESLGQRYLHCSLCGTQWHMLRIKCPRCRSTRGLSYQSLDTVESEGQGSSQAARAPIQAETCDDCGHYLKIMHSDRDPYVEPVADDLASLPLDLLVSDTGSLRHGVNLMLLFGEPPPSTDPGDH